jgi:hypothetical protein
MKITDDSGQIDILYPDLCAQIIGEKASYVL